MYQETPKPRAGRAGTGTDVVIQELAARQHGVVTRAQLLAAGVSRRAVDGRIAKRLLRPVHRGVFQVGPVTAPLMREMAACLACGGAAVVAHRSAAVLWQLLPAPRAGAPVEVLVRGRERRHRGIRVRRVAALPGEQRTSLNGIPVTTATRTLLDLSGSGSARELEQALARALAQGLTSRAKLDRILARGTMRRGTTTIRALLAGSGPALTRSEAEERLLALVRRGGLPQPDVNARVGGFEVDFLWRAERLVAEVDGFAFHADLPAFEKDRRRDQLLVSSGLRVVRITWRQLSREPEMVLVRLAQALVHR